MSLCVSKVVNWHRGGAPIRGKNGEKWPWGKNKESPRRFYVSFCQVGPVNKTVMYITKTSWTATEWYCEVDSLDPPTEAEGVRGVDRDDVETTVELREGE